MTVGEGLWRSEAFGDSIFTVNGGESDEWSTGTLAVLEGGRYADSEGGVPVSCGRLGSGCICFDGLAFFVCMGVGDSITFVETIGKGVILAVLGPECRCVPGRGLLLVLREGFGVS